MHSVQQPAATSVGTLCFILDRIKRCWPTDINSSSRIDRRLCSRSFAINSHWNDHIRNSNALPADAVFASADTTAHAVAVAAATTVHAAAAATTAHAAIAAATTAHAAIAAATTAHAAAAATTAHKHAAVAFTTAYAFAPAAAGAV